MPAAASVALLIFLILAGDVAYRLYQQYDLTRDMVTRLNALVAVLGFAAGLFYFAVDSKRKRRSSTLTEASRLVLEITKTIARLQDKGVPIGKHLSETKTIELAEMQAWSAKVGATHFNKSIGAILNNAEHVAIGVRYGVYDAELTVKYAGTMLVRLWIVFNKFVEQVQTEKDLPTFACELRWFYAFWYYNYREENKDIPQPVTPPDEF